MHAERFLDLYLAESRDCLRRLTASALALERGEPDALAEAFRAAHTLKGMAAAMGQRRLAESAHAVEDRLSEARAGRLRPDAPFIDELLRASDAMEAALSVDADGVEPEGRRPATRSGLPAPAPPPLPGASAVVTVKLRPDAPLAAARAVALAVEARRAGGVVGVRPERPGDDFDGILHVHLAAGAAASGLAGRWRGHPDVEWVGVHGSPNGAAAGGAVEVAGAREGTVRVDRARLDRLAEGIAELSVHFATSEREGNGHGRERAAAVVASLQRTILDLRTVRVSVVHDRAARVVRDAARVLGKEIDLEFTGGDIEMDEAVLDAVAEPLMHILRNAADHGIESPEERAAMGKPRRGRIRLNAERERSSVRITVIDDGRGVVAERVLAAAAERGIVPADTRDETLLRLLMQPGFSTAPTVTDVSGRGVGLDVVGARIRGLGGAIDMTSVAGGGTTFTLRVPFTLAIVHGLRVRVADAEYALPLTHVAEIALLGPGRLERDGDREYVRVRDAIVPLVRLQAVLGGEATGREPAAVVAELGERRVALAVDEVLEHEPIVIRSFDAPVGVPAIFTGATVRADGRPVLLLDPLSMI